MTMFTRAKRVTDPLDDKVKARLRGADIQRRASGHPSSGSEHEASDPPRLSGLVHAFFESDNMATAFNDDSDGAGGELDDDNGERFPNPVDIVRDLLHPKGDQFRTRLLSDAAEALAALRPSESGYRQEVMARLRVAGYNAGICKARWQSCGALTTGSYEYIDVLVAEERYIVDVDFAAEFEIARATLDYKKVVAALPRVMVGRPLEVREVVSMAARAARRSLRGRGLSVPPWRKDRYMLAKWLGPYNRTVDLVPSSAVTTVAGGGEVNCRVVGFRTAPGVFLPTVARIQEERWRGYAADDGVKGRGAR